MRASRKGRILQPRPKRVFFERIVRPAAYQTLLACPPHLFGEGIRRNGVCNYNFIEPRWGVFASWCKRCDVPCRSKEIFVLIAIGLKANRRNPRQRHEPMRLGKGAQECVHVLGLTRDGGPPGLSDAAVPLAVARLEHCTHSHFRQACAWG